LLEHHLNHNAIACNGCRLSFMDKTSALYHFNQHQYISRGYQTPTPSRHFSADDVPPAPHNTPECSAASQTSSTSEQNVMRSTLSPMNSPTVQSPSPSLQPAQRPRPRASSPASSIGSAAAATAGNAEHLRVKLRSATRRLTWLASALR